MKDSKYIIDIFVKEQVFKLMANQREADSITDCSTL